MKANSSIIFWFVLIPLLIGTNKLFSQNEEELSVLFDNITIKEALFEIEKKTNFHFYYNDNWFDNTTIKREYKKTNIRDLLKDLLSTTSLNFSLYKTKIILTKNSRIKNELPINYFTINKNFATEKKSPILLKDYTNRSNNKKDAIITIGKENESSILEEFTISGYVKSFSSNLPINNVKVFINGTNNSTYTNTKGYFSVRAPKGSSSIETELTGYQNINKNIIVFGKGSINFKIEDSIVALSEVVINSSKDENIKKAVIGMIKVDVKGAKVIPTVLGERDILKIATTMPGVKTAGEGSLGYNVRGGKTDQNLILLDNAVLYNPSHFFGVFSAINPFSTGDVSIYKGSIPSEFGGRLSSVIDIKTKEINKSTFSGEGNIGPVTGNLTVEIPLVKDKTAILTGIRSTYSDWILKKIPNEAIRNSEASFLDGIIRIETISNKNNNFKATAYYSKDQFSISSDSLYKYSNQLASLEWNHRINNKHSSKLQLNNSKYKFSIIYKGIVNQNFDLNFNINETSLKYKFKYIYGKNHKFTYGISSKHYYISPGDLKPLDNQSVVKEKTIQKEKALESAIFISDEIKINKKLSFDLGLRYSFYATLGSGTQNIYASNVPISSESLIETKQYNNNEIMQTYGAPEIRVSGRYLLTPSLSLKGGYNKTVQYIHMLSSNTTASPVDSWKLSNLNIKPQSSDQFSIGFFQNFNSNDYEISLEGYYKNMKNVLDYKVGAELMLNENIETELLKGIGKAYGIEFLLKKNNSKLSGWLSYSYSRSFIKLDTKFLTNQINGGDFFASNFDKPHDLSIITNYKMTKRYSFSFNFNYQTGRPITYPIGKYEFAGIEHVLYSDRNQFRIPDYYRVDVGLNIEGNHKIKKLAHSFWNISVYNVLGRNNPYSVFFVNNKGKIKAYKTSIFAIPIPTITYNFKF